MTSHHAVSYPSQPSKESHQDSSPQTQPFPPPLCPGSLPTLPYHNQTQLHPLSPPIPGLLCTLPSTPAPSGDFTQFYSDFVPDDSNMGSVEATYTVLCQLFIHLAVHGLDFGNFVQLLNTYPDLNVQFNNLVRPGSFPGSLAPLNPQTNPSPAFNLEPNPLYFSFEDRV